MSKTSRLLAGLIALVVPFEVAAAEPGAPPSVSCLGPEGERYLQGLLDRIHQLETQLDAEVEAHLSERAEAERRLTQQAASAVDAPKQLAEADGFDREQARKELATLRAALDEATAGRRRAEAEAAAASQTAVTFANALNAAESRLEAADKKLSSATAPRIDVEEAAPTTALAVAHRQEPASKPESEAPTEGPAPPSENDRPEAAPAAAPRSEVPLAEALPTATPAALSEAELAAAQLAALTGRRAAPAVHDAPPAAAPVPSPEPVAPVAAAAAVPTPAPAVEPESARAAAQLAALTGKRSVAPTDPTPAPAPTEPAAPAEPAALGVVEAPPARNRCDQPVETALIEPGDRLVIHVDHLKEVSDTVEVESDGRVHLALVGTLPAAGRNQREFAAELTQHLTPYLQAPRVDVALRRDCGR